MALYDEVTPCSICGDAVGTDANSIIGFTYLGSSHQLVAMLDDSVVHRACLDNWESRDEFVAAWNRESQGVLFDKLVVTENGHVDYQDR